MDITFVRKEIDMEKIAVVYWSGTGNTEKMAHAVCEGIRGADGEATLYEAASFSAEHLDALDGVAFGCPSMGAEELEQMTFEPMFSACESRLKDKKIGLFGSYGWGDGEWMRTWEARCVELGAKFAGESVICCGEPDDVATEGCKELGRLLASS